VGGQLNGFAPGAGTFQFKQVIQTFLVDLILKILVLDDHDPGFAHVHKVA